MPGELTAEESEAVAAAMLQLAEEGRHDELDTLADMTPDELRAAMGGEDNDKGASQMADTFPDADGTD